MFSPDLENNPELIKQLEQAGILMINNVEEALEMSPLSRDSMYIIPETRRLVGLLRHWQGPESDLRALKGKKVLDLAAGSVYSPDRTGCNAYQPTFSRLCAVNGARVVAVDIYPQSDLDLMILDQLQIDLLSLVSGDGLPSHPSLRGQRFDLINSTNFIGANPIEALIFDLDKYGLTKDEFEARFIDQCAQLLADDGVMALGEKDWDRRDVFYKKTDGKLQRSIIER